MADLKISKHVLTVMASSLAATIAPLAVVAQVETNVPDPVARAVEPSSTA